MATVLIVDDDPNVIATLRSFLIEEGFTVRTARDGVQALDRLLRAPVAFVISNVHMPAIDGRTLVQEMRRRGDRAPVLLMSGYDHMVEVEPNTRFLRKPFDLDQLLDAIAWAMAPVEAVDYRSPAQ